MTYLRNLLLGASALAASTTGLHAEPLVLASIKPIHSLVAAVMAGVGSPELIVEGAASPHTYSLKPSQAEALQNARVVVWIGHDMEAFLTKPITTIAADAKAVELEDLPGLIKLAPREGGTFEPHDHDDHADDTQPADGAAAEEHHHDEEVDPHFWLDPVNAKVMVQAIEASLSEADPANAAIYKTNAEAELAKLDNLITEVQATVDPVKDRGFIAFHDAYQYFEKRFGMQASGSITVNPELLPGARRVDEIRAKIDSLGATCVFSEPQFEPKLVSVVLEGSVAKSGVLDPLGATLTDGPDLYFELIRGLAKSLSDCLSGKG
ncbi:zinc transport system substrate-binding protein [Hoeflea marina]|uniref:High-affinity zinc uptake system protein ZnuA n=1 Tax=Hoeflea marina TaxID=274592 RepID=A0A317PLP4_9HYPH|nr:zinc ABC transporter substrate-binding protein [Hoeflea marina]PWW01667.1 zinc transport system substrate-binding protein [Hoeflea marina]